MSTCQYNTDVSGHPSDYLKGYSVARTLAGHGMRVEEADGEDLDSLYNAIVQVVAKAGPAACVIKRKMAPHIKGIEGQTAAHDAIKV